MAEATQRGTSSTILAAVDPGDALLAAPIDLQRAVLATVVSVHVVQSRPEARGKRLNDDSYRSGYESCLQLRRQRAPWERRSTD